MENDTKIDQRLSRLEAVVGGLAESVNALTSDVRTMMTGKPTNWGWIISAASLVAILLTLLVSPIYKETSQNKLLLESIRQKEIEQSYSNGVRDEKIRLLESRKFN